jgi:hypothetical protein
MSELLCSTVKVPHEDLGWSWRFHSSVKINSLLPNDLDPEGFYGGRDKSCLEWMT